MASQPTSVITRPANPPPQLMPRTRSRGAERSVRGAGTIVRSSVTVGVRQPSGGGSGTFTPLETRRNTRPRGSVRAKPPALKCCSGCGKQFGIHSLAVHQKRCNGLSESRGDCSLQQRRRQPQQQNQLKTSEAPATPTTPSRNMDVNAIDSFSDPSNFVRAADGSLVWREPTETPEEKKERLSREEAASSGVSWLVDNVSDFQKYREKFQREQANSSSSSHRSSSSVSEPRRQSAARERRQGRNATRSIDEDIARALSDSFRDASIVESGDHASGLSTTIAENSNASLNHPSALDAFAEEDAVVRSLTALGTQPSAQQPTSMHPASTQPAAPLPPPPPPPPPPTSLPTPPLASTTTANTDTGQQRPLRELTSSGGQLAAVEAAEAAAAAARQTASRNAARASAARIAFRAGDDSYENLLLLDEFSRNRQGSGLTTAELRKLPSCVVTANSESTCSICLEAFAEGSHVIRLPGCSHVFHGACAGPWFAAHTECPNCRCDVRQQRGICG